MHLLRRLKLKQKFIVCLLICGVMPAFMVALANYTSTRSGALQLEREAENELRRCVMDRLVAVRDSRKAMKSSST